jgi:hypothetical protein
MRALSGAIITAAALIGLGLTAQGIGTRYASFYVQRANPAAEGGLSNAVRGEPDFERSQIKIHQMDNALKLTVTLLILSLLIGLGITFVGLMYHHHRRYQEHLRDFPSGTASSTHLTP